MRGRESVSAPEQEANDPLDVGFLGRTEMSCIGLDRRF
jgi:hypothetical protein